RFIGVSINLVRDRKIAECRPPYKWFRFMQQARRSLSRLEQHGLHLPPGRLISNSNCRVEDQAFLLGQCAVVYDFGITAYGVWHRDQFIRRSAKISRHHVYFFHIPHIVADFDSIALFEQEPIRHAIPGDYVPNERSGTEGKNDTDKESDTFKSLRT